MDHKILIDPCELVLMKSQQDVVIVDTRDPLAYAECHIEGAINIHEIFTYLASSTPEGAAHMREYFASVFQNSGIGDDDCVVFYEGGMETGFGQSCRGHFLLSYLGHDHSYVLHGGLKAWRAAGLSVTDQVTQRDPARLTLSDQGCHLIVGKDDVLAELDQDRVTLLDVRDVDEWVGASSSPYGKDFAPRKGRIPGAKWLEWYRLMKPVGDAVRVKDPCEVRADCLNVGVDLDKPVWLYCFKGARTSNTFVALKQAGIKDVRTYFGSWNEWSRDLSLPIESGFPRPHCQ